MPDSSNGQTIPPPCAAEGAPARSSESDGEAVCSLGEDDSKCKSNRIKRVTPRAFEHFVNGQELVLGIFGAVVAHKEIYERADGELHGDIAPHTLVFLDHADPATTAAAAPSGSGALIYLESPISVQTAAKLGRPRDPVYVPLAAQRDRERAHRAVYYRPPPGWC
ncbi:hypothetical protein BD413DRAFT_674734 [Trametes elegans]|nr:hypothetical protein BD413DRAFT_674734 [Trametes elegans]